MKQVRVFIWQGQWSSRFQQTKPVRPAALCRGVTTENRKARRSAETELNGVEEELDEISDENRNEIDGE